MAHEDAKTQSAWRIRHEGDQKHELARERGETDSERAERLVPEQLSALGWKEEDLSREGKAHPEKACLARRIRQETPMTREWIARRLEMGSASYVSQLLGNGN